MDLFKAELAPITDLIRLSAVLCPLCTQPKQAWESRFMKQWAKEGGVVRGADVLHTASIAVIIDSRQPAVIIDSYQACYQACSCLAPSPYCKRALETTRSCFVVFVFVLIVFGTWSPYYHYCHYCYHLHRCAPASASGRNFTRWAKQSNGIQCLSAYNTHNIMHYNNINKDQ
eukprot:COSAG06_NODE_14011_length_1197_cov_264.514660_2_plen_172_part_00